MLVLENVSKIYENPYSEDDRILVLRGIDLTLEGGNCNFILGKSGSGKSTFLRLVAGIEQPTTGKILFNNVQINTIKKKERILFWQKHVGFINQDPLRNLIASFNVEQNIRLPMKILGKLSREEQKKRVIDLLDYVDLPTKLHRKVTTLSGGEQQRIAVCVGIANNPDLILADEPTGELDSKNAVNIITLLRNLIKDNDIIEIIVTHNNSLMQELDTQFTINKGLIEKK